MTSHVILKSALILTGSTGSMSTERYIIQRKFNPICSWHTHIDPRFKSVHFNNIQRIVQANLSSGKHKLVKNQMRVNAGRLVFLISQIKGVVRWESVRAINLCLFLHH